MKNSIIVVGIFMMVALVGLVQANPSCGASLPNGTTVLDADLDCSGMAIALNLPNDNALLDCNGYNILNSSSTLIYITGDNITIRNCGLYPQAQAFYIYTANGVVIDNVTNYPNFQNGNDYFILHEDSTDVTLKNSNIEMDGTTNTIIHFEAYANPDNLYIFDNNIFGQFDYFLGGQMELASGGLVNMNVTGNNFNTTSLSANILNLQSNDDTISWDSSNSMYNNNFYGNFITLGVIGAGNFIAWNVSDSTLFGNYYDYFQPCTDTTPVDGICDSPLTSALMIDNYPLSSPAPYTPCSPDWSCTGYESCNISDLASCNAVIDNNACGDNYSGDYSEFIPQSCNYCSYDVVLVSQTDCDAYTDTKTVSYIDNNFATCCNITGLVSDCYFGNESIGQVNESCSFFAYTENDIAGATMNTIVKFLLAFGSLVTVVVVGLGIAYGVKSMRTKR